MKKKIIAALIFVGVLFLAKFILWDFKVSSGKRVGNLTKISKKGKIFKTWEGTIDEGSGDKLTSYFSVSSDEIGNELYNYEGRQVLIYYSEHILGWPRDTKYDVISWKPKEAEAISETSSESSDSTTSETDSNSKEISRVLFCTMLGSLYKDKELYTKIKEYIKKDNLFLYNQYDKCNE